jgi:hypothetical protein
LLRLVLLALYLVASFSWSETDSGRNLDPNGQPIPAEDSGRNLDPDG